MMRLFSKIAFAVMLVAIVSLVWSMKKQTKPPIVESREPSEPVPVLAAQGRVEGRGETISLGAGADGVVKDVLVTEGQQVSKGTVLARIDCEDIQAAIEMAQAQADSAQQAKVRLLRGHRDEERKAALQNTEAAKAVLSQAQEHFGRFEALYEKGEISRDAFEQAQRDFEVAKADYERAVDEESLVNADPLPEEISRADAEIMAAERNVNLSTERLGKCEVRAPITGTILKVLTKTGESYSTLVPRPLFTLADESVRRIRAEVDERDISKIKLGQSGVITADAFPGQRFEGEVVQISPAMKQESVLSEDPSQKVDRDVLDVLLELRDAGKELPIGLRVTAQLTSNLAVQSLGISSERALPLARADSVTRLKPISTSATVSSTTPTPASATAAGARTAIVATPLVSQDARQSTSFFLQVGAMAHKENADALAQTLRAQKFPAVVLERQGDSFFRVDLGPYPNPEDMRNAKAELKENGFGDALERRLPTPTR
jgi:HlyD family secretion protein